MNFYFIKKEKMNGIFYLIFQKEFERENNEKIIGTQKSIEDSVPLNRAECLIW